MAILRAVWGWIREGVFQLLILLGMILIGVVLLWKEAPVPAVLLSLAQTVLVAGIFGAVSKSSLFLGVYRTTLAKVVAEPAHMMARKDVKEIWSSVTTALLGGTFPGLIDSVSNKILQKYITASALRYYYKEFDQHIRIVAFDPTSRILTIEETTIIEAEPGAGGTYELEWEWCPSITVDGKHNSTVTLLELRIDGKAVDASKFKDAELANGRKGKRYTHEFSKAARVERRTRRAMDLSVDPMMLQTVKSFVEKLRVSVTNPICDTIGIVFEDVGTTDEFTCAVAEQIPGTAVQHLVMDFKTLMFPRQGYIVTYVEKSPRPHPLPVAAPAAAPE